MFAGSLGASVAVERATKDEAVAMVKKAVAFIKQQGAEKAYAEISNKKGQFVDRDLYIVVYRLDGHVLAHGANEKLIGTDQIAAKDPDGKEFVKERTELAQKQDSFWQNYKNFLRLKFAKDKLTIYPLGIDKVPGPDHWKNVPRGKANPIPSNPKLIAVKPIEVRLIESPIVIPAGD